VNETGAWIICGILIAAGMVVMAAPWMRR